MNRRVIMGVAMDYLEAQPAEMVFNGRTYTISINRESVAVHPRGARIDMVVSLTLQPEEPPGPPPP